MTPRRARPGDAPAVAALHRASRLAAMPTIVWPHDAAEDLRWVENVLLPTREVWLAERDGALRGLLGLHEGWVEHLYLAPGHWRRGLGRMLMDHAKALQPDGLRLWCFQVNAGARAFYAAQGFTVIRLTDGAGNEEREPDMLLAWQGAHAAPGAAAVPRA